MNDENLKKGEATRFRSGEDAVRNGQKGGIASGKARRAKADMRKILLDMLDEEVTSKNGEKMTLGARMTKSMIAIASDPRQGASALKAYQTIMHIIGQDEPEIQKEESSFDLDEFKIKLDEQEAYGNKIQHRGCSSYPGKNKKRIGKGWSNLLSSHADIWEGIPEGSIVKNEKTEAAIAMKAFVDSFSEKWR